MAPSLSATCEVCEETFDSRDHKPVVLPCGHTFCYCCIQRLDGSSEELGCPKCRKSHNVDVSMLPVCYQLIPRDDEAAAAQEQEDPAEENSTCKEHKEKFTHWCCSCKCQLCHRCFHPRHASCKILPIGKIVEEDSKELTQALENLSLEVPEVEKWLQTRLEESQRKTQILEKLVQSITDMQDLLREETDYLHASILQLKFDKSHYSTATKRALTAESKRGVMAHCSRLFQITENSKQFEDLSLENLCDFAQFFERNEETAYEEKAVFLEQYLQSRCNAMEADGDWVIENDTQAHVAHTTLTRDGSLRPFEVTFKSVSERIHSMKVLLPFFASNVRSLNLQLLDTFWQNNAGFFPDSDDALLEELLGGPDKSKLRHFIGCVSHKTLAELKTVELYTLGLHVYSHGFVKSLNTLLHPLVPVYHLCLHRRVRPEQLPALAQHLYRESCVHLHFAELCDADLEWVCRVATALVPAAYCDFRVQSLTLPRCRLSAEGLLTLLGDTSRLSLCPDVSCQHETLSAADRRAVSSRAARLGLCLTWTVQL